MRYNGLRSVKNVIPVNGKNTYNSCKKINQNFEKKLREPEISIVN